MFLLVCSLERLLSCATSRATTRETKRDSGELSSLVSRRN